MTRKPSTIACVGALVAGLAAPAFADPAGPVSETETLRQEVSQLRAEIAEMRQQQRSSERSSEDVQVLVHEILSDAEGRTTMQGGIEAGHDGEHFFIGSTDDRFRLHVGGQLQVRGIGNIRDDSTVMGQTVPADTEAVGLEVPRAKLNFWGHIASPRLEYSLTLRGDERHGTGIEDGVYLEEALISYELIDDITIWAGQTKAPYAREELIDSSRQLAVERSLVNQVFTIGAVQGLGVDAEVHEMVRVKASVNNGVRSGEPRWRNRAAAAKFDYMPGQNNPKGFVAPQSDFAVTARADVKVFGDWDQANEFTAWQGEPMAVFVGGAGHFEKGATGGSGQNNADFWSFTVDGSVQHLGWNAFAAGHFLRTDRDLGNNSELWGAVVQGGYNIDDTFEPFARWEYLDLSGASTALMPRADNYINLVTAGLNWYHNRHNAKLTADVVYALDAIPAAGMNSALNTTASDLRLLGLRPDPAGDDDQIAVRLQYQLLF